MRSNLIALTDAALHVLGPTTGACPHLSMHYLARTPDKNGRMHTMDDSDGYAPLMALAPALRSEPPGGHGPHGPLVAVDVQGPVRIIDARIDL